MIWAGVGIARVQIRLGRIGIQGLSALVLSDVPLMLVVLLGIFERLQ